jgi:energy-coupling factor transporter ATP-binding protein EcfA2
LTWRIGWERRRCGKRSVRTVSVGTVGELVGWWRHLPPREGSCRVLAVEGRSGAGKTTLAAALVAAAPDAAGVAMDELYPGWDGLEAGIGLLVEQVLAPLAAGRPAWVPRWDWAAGRPAGGRPLAAAGLVLVEGVGSGAAACAPYLSGLVWVEADDATRRRRALERDGAAYAPHWGRWAAQEEAYLRRDRPRERADRVVGPPQPGGVR